MPKAVYETPGVRESMVRPVVLDIVRQVLEWTGLPRETKVLFPGEHGRALQPGSTISNEAQFNEFETKTRWVIEVSEKTQLDQIIGTSIDYADHPPIFKDDETKVYIRPIYNPTDFEIKIIAKSADRNQARMMRKDATDRVAQGRDVRVHSASYSYLIPVECYEIAQEIHRMRENIAPYGEDMANYWGRNVSNKATILSDLTGKNQQWGIAETQARIVGFFDWEGEPEEGEKNPDNSSVDISFTYTVKLDVPSAVWMNYPLMIHNQLLDEAYRQDGLPPRVEDTALQYSQTAANYSWFETSRLSQGRGIPGFAIPDFDEFFPADRAIPPDTLRVLTALTSIDTSEGGDPLFLVDFNDLGENEIDPDILAFMRDEAAWLNKVRISIFNVIVYEDDLAMAPNSYYVTSDLKVMLVNPPNLRKTYHVRFALFQRPRLLPEDAKTRMRKHCTATIKIMATLDPKVLEQNPYCMPGDYMARDVFNDMANQADITFDPKFDGNNYGFNTVMQFFINARRNSDAIS